MPRSSQLAENIYENLFPVHVETLADGTVKLILVPKNQPLFSSQQKLELHIPFDYLAAWMTGESTGNEEAEFGNRIVQFIQRLPEISRAAAASAGAGYEGETATRRMRRTA